MRPTKIARAAGTGAFLGLFALFNVGLALDPEWKLTSSQQPLHQIGHVDIAEANSVIRWLAALTARYHLPQKLLVLHQFQLSMLTGERGLDTGHDDLSIVIHMDGQGVFKFAVKVLSEVVDEVLEGRLRWRRRSSRRPNLFSFLFWSFRRLLVRLGSGANGSRSGYRRRGANHSAKTEGHHGLPGYSGGLYAYLRA